MFCLPLAAPRKTNKAETKQIANLFPKYYLVKLITIICFLTIFIFSEYVLDFNIYTFLFFVSCKKCLSNEALKSYAECSLFALQNIGQILKNSPQARSQIICLNELKFRWFAYI